MDRVADAVRPESLKARTFNQQVNAFIENPDYQEEQEEIKQQLSRWKENHKQLLPFIQSSPPLQDIDEISKALANLSEAAIQVLEKGTQYLDKDDLEHQLTLIEKGEHGVLVAVAPGLRKLLLEMPGI